ncbi:3-mercaptopyruvate sulfurtransferase SseA [Ancylobacter aquaticus]|uniref:3-mercaptopyruvate sulfurtransferase SseA n=1 Tax=Ancylobacter aquaticus TaxID=100 RepID=A0A4R1HG58_ANCAQ|nr:rhodanese-like domain-containing protein [Ancylobacter aquaticus]TCK19723.1 3-mercaptopyruvate sulfurtransferase SseA [Ancylobacter aquaticus]
MSANFPRIDAATLHATLSGDTEIALLDVREEGVFASAHILTASNTPISRFERIVPALVPRRATPIVLVDDDETLATRAAGLLRAHGYDDVSILHGGVPAWKSAGFELFAGVYVPSKAFAEFVEVEYATPHIDAHELQARRAAGEDIVLLDSRPYDEYNWITIPGAIDCPGAELVLCAREVIPSDETLVVVNCGGRTRSIIGAQILIDASLPNRVVSLKDGTQGWHLAGLDVARGQDQIAPKPSPKTHDWARHAAEALATRLNVPTIGAATLARFETERDDTTLYRFDVRGTDEYRHGHRPGFLSAPGGQLVQATDTYIAMRAARIVLADSDGVRARSTAAWLARLGFPNVYVLDENAPAGRVETGAAPEIVLGLDGASAETVTAAELSALLAQGDIIVVDLATSRQYRAGHIPGAWFSVRGRLATDASKLPVAPLYVVTSPDEVIARLAVAELAQATGAVVKLLAGGTDAWSTAGLPLETTPENLASRTDDVLLKSFERREDREAAMREYLQWELDLVEQVRRDGTLQFRL